MAIDVASSAGCACSVRLRASSGPFQATLLIDDPSAASAASKTAAAAGETAASAWPMPTNCDPWPGKMNATVAMASLDVRTGRGRPAGARPTRFLAARTTRRLSAVLPEWCVPISGPSVDCVQTCTRQGRSTYAVRHMSEPDSHPVTGDRSPIAVRRRPRAASVRAIARRFEADLATTALSGGPRTANVRQISERVAMGRALWRELVIGFASQLGELRLGFTQLAALYVLADGSTLTIGELAEALGRSPSATSRLVDGLVRRRLLERRAEPEDRRQRSLGLTQRGHAVLRAVDRARADQFLTAVRPLPTAERALVAMGVAALATRAFSRRGRFVRGEPG